MTPPSQPLARTANPAAAPAPPSRRGPYFDEAPPSLCARCGIRAVALQGFCEGCWDLRCVWADETVDDA